MKKQTPKSNTKTALAIGAGILALTAGAYYFFGPEGKKHQKKMKGWMIKMKGEVVEKLENTKELTEETYTMIVDKIAEKYAKANNIDSEDVRRLAKELKKHWKGMTETISGKKATKKATTKLPKNKE